MAQTFSSGVGAPGRSLRAFFARRPAASTVYWVSYNADLPAEVLAAKQQRGFRLVVVCQHPLSGRPSMSVDAWKRMTSAGCELLGIGGGLHSGTDADADAPDRLHAKLVVSTCAESSWFTGSFNASNGGWSENYELIVEHRDTSGREAALEVARQLEDWAQPIQIEHTGPAEFGSSSRRAPGPGEKVGEVLHKGSRARPPKPAKTPDELTSPKVLAQLAEHLDTRMATWPDGAGRGRQAEIYAELEARVEGTKAIRDLLWLPVGCGKTYIALRWLCHQVCTKRPHRPAAFLAPNQWVQESVSSQLDRLCEEAELNRSDVDKYIRVVRPKDLGLPGRRKYSALVADECHNWDPRTEESGADTRATYSSRLSPWLGKTPILGMSATPCRMENNRFDFSSFISAFIGSRPSSAQLSRAMTLRDAARAGFITDYRFEKIAHDSSDEAKALLSTVDGAFISMGDYAKTVLRAVWETIARDPESLANEIMQSLRRHKRRRAVIFLPPVEHGADAFVRALRDRNGARIFDFRSSIGSGEDVFEEIRRFNPSDRKPALLVTIDRFSEGVSVDDIDALVMLRATLSPRVVIQSLGRGLRRAKGKRDCLVLDAVFFEERLAEVEAGGGSQGEDRPVLRRSGSKPTKNEASLSRKKSPSQSGRRTETQPHLKTALVANSEVHEWIQRAFKAEGISAPTRKQLRADLEALVCELPVPNRNCYSSLPLKKALLDEDVVEILRIRSRARNESEVLREIRALFAHN